MNWKQWSIVAVSAAVFGATYLPTLSTKPQTTPTIARTPYRLLLGGEGEQNTVPLVLSGGAYALALHVTGRCFYSTTLVSTSNNASRFQGPTVEKPGQQSTNLYSVPAGSYYLWINTGPGCPWKVDLHSQ